MATIKRFEDLEIWQLARELAKEIFELTKKGELVKDFKLRDQMRASSGSTMDNIAEGFERGGNKEFFQFLSIAKGSNGELKSQIARTLDRQHIQQSKFDYFYNKADILSKKISALMNYIDESKFKGSKYS